MSYGVNLKVGERMKDRKLRAYDKFTNKIIYRTDDVFEQKNYHWFPNLNKVECIRLDTGDKLPIMEYVGQEDYANTPIYEGDIVQVKTHDNVTIHEVRWFGDMGYPAFDLYPSINSKSNGLHTIFECEDMEILVVGNIYDDPRVFEK